MTEQHRPLTPSDLADARQWVQAGRAAAIERFPYLDVALTSMVLVESTGLGTVATDARWRFYYDPARVLGFPKRERLRVMVSDWVHEVGHLLRDHAQRWSETGDPAQWHPVFNGAGDAVINRDLQSLGLTVLATDVTFERLPDEAGVTSDMVTEEIYSRLKRVTRTIEVADCGSGSGGPQRPWELAVGSGENKGTGGSGEQPGADGSVDPERCDLIRHETASKIRSHIRSHGTESVPHGMRGWADTVLEPIVDWRRELRAAVSRGLSQAAGRADYSFVRPPRRRVPGYITPGMAAPDPPSVAVVVDTSGSMSPDDLAQCIADIAALTRSIGGPGGQAVSVIPCDTHVGSTTRVRTRADIPHIRLSGGGGTNMCVGIEAAAKLRPTPDVVVTLTDGYTPWPDEQPGVAPRTRFIAVIVDEGCGAGPPDWIHTIRRAG